MAAILAGSTALVTGATSGIRLQMALELAARGAEVVVHGRRAERGAKAVRDIENAGGTARFVAADLNDADDVRRLAGEGGTRRHPDQQRRYLQVRRPTPPVLRSSEECWKR